MTVGPDRRIVRRTARRTGRRVIRRQAGGSDRPPEEPEPTPASLPSPVGIEGRLKQLADLHASGALTDSEFSQAKAKLLAG